MNTESTSLRTRTVACTPYADQRMGTAGLRRKVAVLRQPHYLESFIQAVLDTLSLRQGASLVIGGDGRFFNDVAIQTIIRMAAAAGATHLIVGRDGLLSTPAASNLIRTRRADGGFLLTASHNPGGPSGDFGVKFNMPTGGQAPEQVTDAVFEATKRIYAYHLADLPLLDLARTGVQRHGQLTVEIVDPVDAYQQLMEKLFDFERIAHWIRSGHRVVFDGMHGITGPYAQRILGEALGVSPEGLMHTRPLPDFGGLHPDPNPVDCRHLVDLCALPAAPDLAAASDGDGDRNMILGPAFMLSPGDSVAMLLANARLAPGYRYGVPGVARSMPTSRAVDRVAAQLGIPCFETPTGWRYFCNLLEADRIGLCGEESFGTGSSHTREKDGLWAVLFWMNVLAAREISLPALAASHWREHGRHYYQRHDYEIPDAARGAALMEELRRTAPQLVGRRAGDACISWADDFCYRDPVDGSESAHQGVRVVLDDDSRIVFRLSGTGTAGATLRVYLERYEPDPARHALDTTAVLAALGREAASLARITAHAGPAAPTMIV